MRNRTSDLQILRFDTLRLNHRLSKVSQTIASVAALFHARVKTEKHLSLFNEFKIYGLSNSVYTHGAFHISDPRSVQNDSELYEAQTYETYGQLSWNQLQGMGKNWMSKEENVMKELRKVSCNPVICGR